MEAKEMEAQGQSKLYLHFMLLSPSPWETRHTVAILEPSQHFFLTIVLWMSSYRAWTTSQVSRLASG